MNPQPLSGAEQPVESPGLTVAKHEDYPTSMSAEPVFCTTGRTGGDSVQELVPR
jgi:hypothetical protein